MKISGIAPATAKACSKFYFETVGFQRQVCQDCIGARRIFGYVKKFIFRFIALLCSKNPKTSPKNILARINHLPFQTL